MIRAFIFALVFAPPLARSLEAQQPTISITITTKAETGFGRIVPIAALLREEKFNEVDFKLGDEGNVNVEIQIRSDYKVISRAEAHRIVTENMKAGKDISAPQVFLAEKLDDLSSRLKKAGADNVEIVTRHRFPRDVFALKQFNALKTQGKTIVVISVADWSVHSILLKKQVLGNAELIDEARRSGFKFFVLDITNKPRDDDLNQFIKAHNLVPLSVLVFRPDQQPTKLSDQISPEAFRKHVFTR